MVIISKYNLIIENELVGTTIVFKIIGPDYGSNTNKENILLTRNYDLKLPYDENGVKLINKHYHEINNNNNDNIFISELILSKFSNYEMDYNKIDEKFKDLINEITIDCYNFSEQEITKISINWGRKISKMIDLKLYCNLIKSRGSYNWNELIIKKICNIDMDVFKESLDLYNTENIASKKGSYKMKQKYSNLFYSYLEMYEQLNINLDDLMVIEVTWGRIISSKEDGAGRDTVHQIWKFTFKCEENQKELRKDFCRLLFYKKELKREKNNDIKYCFCINSFVISLSIKH